MKVKLTRLNNAFHFEAKDSEGKTVQIDASPQMGGEGKGVRPMELLLMAAGGCSSIDLGLILKKQKQELTDYSVEVSGERNDDAGKAYNHIHFDFKFWGALDERKVQRAIDLTLTKYCSVVLSIDPAVKITHAFEINPSQQ